MPFYGVPGLAMENDAEKYPEELKIAFQNRRLTSL